MSDRAESADGAPHCPICDAVSEYLWRCSECGKLLKDEGKSRDLGRSVLGGGR